MLGLVGPILGCMLLGNVGWVRELLSGMVRVVGVLNLFSQFRVGLFQLGAGVWALAIFPPSRPHVLPNLCLHRELGLAPPAARKLDNRFVQNTTGSAKPLFLQRCAPHPPLACASQILVPHRVLHPLSLLAVQVLMFLVIVMPLLVALSCISPITLTFQIYHQPSVDLRRPFLSREVIRFSLCRRRVWTHALSSLWSLIFRSRALLSRFWTGRVSLRGGVTDLVAARPNMVLLMCPDSGKLVSTLAAPSQNPRARKGLLRDPAAGRLRQSRVTACTRLRYEEAYRTFAREMSASTKLLHDPGAIDITTLDCKMEIYIERLFALGKPKSFAVYAVASLYFLACVSKRVVVMPRTLAALKGWGKLQPDRSREPCPWVVALLISKFLADRPGQLQLLAARALLIQFSLLLRPSELISASLSSAILGKRSFGTSYNKMALVVAPSHNVEDDDHTFDLKPSKTNTFDDTITFDDCLIEPRVKELFGKQVLLARQSGWKTLWGPLSYTAYARLIRSAVAGLKLPYQVTPHMFRHGGASEDYLRGLRSLEAIQIRGRWDAFASVRRYQKSGRLLRMVQALPAHLRQEAQVIEKLRCSWAA